MWCPLGVWTTAQSARPWWLYLTIYGRCWGSHPVPGLSRARGLATLREIAHFHCWNWVNDQTLVPLNRSPKIIMLGHLFLLNNKMLLLRLTSPPVHTRHRTSQMTFRICWILNGKPFRYKEMIKGSLLLSY